LGRFIGQDPLEFYAGDYNFYRYVRNDPVRHVDPTGKTEDVEDAVVTGLVRGGVAGAIEGFICGLADWIFNDRSFSQGLVNTGVQVAVSALNGAVIGGATGAAGALAGIFGTRSSNAMNEPSYICPCCGYNGLTSAPYTGMSDVSANTTGKVDPPYAKYFGMPSYEVCDCCGYEFGNDDEPGTADPVSFEMYRKEWIAKGCQWFSPNKKPKDWNVENQLRNLGLA
jgi:hypothetical protein